MVYQVYSSTSQVIDDIKKGNPFILLDAESRENEGDIVMPAQYVNSQTLDFMQSIARGVICLAIDEDTRIRLDLDFMPRRGVESSSTAAFTVSIEAAKGVNTGASLHERAHTIKTAANPQSKPSDIITPGHVFPIVANPKGLRERHGHTEGSIHVCKLANILPAAVLCEIMDENGHSASRDNLFDFAKKHNLKILTMEQLIAEL